MRRVHYRRLNPDGTQAPPTYQERVKRIYPRAICQNEDDGYYVLANNGTGNILATSTVSPFDAWQRAAAAVQPPRRATV